MRSDRPVGLVIAGVLLVAFYGQCTRAETRVQGPADDIRVEAYGATVAEILTAVGEHYAVRYRGVPRNSVITATFAGSLRRVLVRVLKEDNYVIKGDADGLEVILVSLEPVTARSPAGIPVAAALVSQVQLRVQGPADDVRVEAHGATVADIFTEFGERYAIRYRGLPGNGIITTTAAGPLRQVLVRLLKGNNYVIKGDGDGLEVIVLSPESIPAVAPAMPAMVVRRRAD